MDKVLGFEYLETNDVIVQIGNEDMRKPETPASSTISWNLVYSDFLLENNVVGDYKKLLFANKEDSLKYVNLVASTKNREHKPENGLFTDKYANGNIKEQGNYKNGLKEGIWQIWHENGVKADSAYYVHDEEVGKCMMWYANGKVELDRNFGTAHDRIGTWTHYYESGQIESITHFDNDGNLDGKDTQYYQNGEIKKITTYSKEHVISEVSYDSTGLK